ncbi:TonB-dependent receptor domain-containing protein [Rubrivivax sp. RP6-9]|uniref:TonB-dependent receptor domain-containing protein n=1 Tax=Rubrivivax sp. RP6-9 TaxID=3415750 RepID=UPI003CC5BFD8
MIEQPSQALAESLRSIARQTGTSVLFDPGVVSGKTARAVSGRLTAVEAISRAIDGSGMSADVMKDGAIVVKPAPSTGGVPPGSSGARSSPNALTVASPDASAAAQLALATAPLQSDARAAAPAGDAEPPAEAQRIEITGSRLKRVAAEGPAPVNTYSREDVERSGQPTLERFLSSLSEVSVAAGEGSFGATGGQGTVQLRGLPLGSTLTLINGRRVQAVGSSSGNYFNLNLIPLSAVERVEVLPVGSSAVYGGDALAGVVNVILKKSIDGLALDARLGAAKGIGDGSVSLAGGGGDERGSYLLLGSYSKRSALTMAERAFFRDADYRRFGGSDQRARTCAPGTVSSTDGSNLPGLDASFAGIPSVSAGPLLSTDDFVPTAGTANLCSGQSIGKGYTLVHGLETLGLHASGERYLTGAWSIFGELTRTEDRLSSDEAALLLNNVLVPASNTYNPFGVDVRVTGALGPENGVQTLDRRTRFTRALFGVRGDLGGGWDLEVTGSGSRDSGTSRTSGVSANPAARTAALASPVAESALNPFTAGRAASDQVLRAIWPESLRTSRGQRDQLGGFVRGPLLNLPAGSMDVIAGVEAGRDSFESAIPGVLAVAADRTQRAAYTELRAPLLRSSSVAARSWDLAVLTLAARRDAYSDFGSASTYQAGLEVRPARTLLLRASAATSFKPPTLLQTNVPDQSFPTEAFGLVDPARGNEPVVGGEVVRSTNPALEPERGKAYAVGAIWEPDGTLGTRLGMTAWKVRIDGLIGLAFPQVLVNNEGLFPGVVRRGPPTGTEPGPITRVLWGEVNYGAVDTSGIDLEASHAWKALGGTWALAAGATRTRAYQVVLAPAAPAEDRLGRRYYDFWSPAWKGRLSAGFDQGGWSMGLTSRYVGTYQDGGTSERRLGNLWTHDLNASLDLVRLGLVSGTTVKGAAVSFGIVNVTDRQPEFVEANPFYDPTQADWRGRYASARLSVNW